MSTTDQQADDGIKRGATARTSRFPQWLLTNRWGTAPSWPAGLALVAILSTFWLVGGLAGIGAWLILAVAWIVLPVLVPFALGYLALVALAPDAGITATLPAQVSLFGLLIADSVRWEISIGKLGVLVGGTVVLAAVALWAARTAGLLIAGVVSLGLVCLVSYFLHRYLIVRLGLVANDEETEE